VDYSFTHSVQIKSPTGPADRTALLTFNAAGNRAVTITPDNCQVAACSDWAVGTTPYISICRYNSRAGSELGAARQCRGSKPLSGSYLQEDR
jgi:hypothetical protein